MWVPLPTVMQYMSKRERSHFLPRAKTQVETGRSDYYTPKMTTAGSIITLLFISVTTRNFFYPEDRTAASSKSLAIIYQITRCLNREDRCLILKFLSSSLDPVTVLTELS
jgi:hypothetical protein